MARRELLGELRLGPQSYREPVAKSSLEQAKGPGEKTGAVIGAEVGEAIGTVVNTIGTLFGNNTLVLLKVVPESCSGASVGTAYATNAAYTLTVVRLPEK